jgi:hypothetical protein
MDLFAVFNAVYAPSAAPLELTEAHLALIRNLRVTWSPVESGGPAIDLWRPLAGDDSTVELAMNILDTDDDEAAARTLAEVGLLIVPFLDEGAELPPGRYQIPMDRLDAFDEEDMGVNGDGYFDFREEHLTLLRAMDWIVPEEDSLEEIMEGMSDMDDEGELWPMPSVDGKRPYGNRTDYTQDMAEILHIPDDEVDQANLERLHLETLAALQVFLIYAQPMEA